MFHSQQIEYHDDDVLLEGYAVFPNNLNSKKPIILVVHDWSGINEFAREKANQLAGLGYIGFAIDMYGKGRTGKTKDEKIKLMQPLMQDRNKLKNRILAAFEAAKKINSADADRIGAIGFCFGGLCVLDLARSGVEVTAVVSFHGLLNAPERMAKKIIKAKILVLHGFIDPMVTPDQVIAFGSEMTEAKADWQLDIYGNVMHGFTNPEANDPSFGTVYNKSATMRSWAAMEYFFKETFIS